jgi:very-short-patch-repair endonuclease
MTPSLASPGRGEIGGFGGLSPVLSKQAAKPDVRIAEIAARQHGVVSVAQLRRASLGDEAIHRRVVAGRLHRVHRGVYAVGHAGLSPYGRWLAAVLTIGRGPREEEPSVLAHWGAALSHRSAAALWELVSAKDEPCDVVVRGTGGRDRRAGIRVHRSISLTVADVTLRYGIPVTTPARTIADLRYAVAARRSGAVSARELRRAVRQAGVLGLPIDEEDAKERTRSDLEEEFLEICRRHRLPRPEVNVRLGPHLVDFLWRERRLVVESDGYRYHRGRQAFQDDRGRDLDLRRRGFEVLRLSERQLDKEAERVVEVLSEALGVD